MKSNLKFFKENFVLGVGILQAIIILLFLFINNKELFKLIINGLKYFGIIIFIIWLNDDRYKFLYYFYYVLVSIVIGSCMLNILLPILINVVVNSRNSLIIVLSILCILEGVVSQFFYNLFKEMSYKKNPEQ
nr:MAG TPA: hypothetical protein [Caudoviricetes sp.]